MKPLFWIVGIPLMLCGAFFAVSNRQAVLVDLWPLAERVEIPLFVALIGALYVGFGAGALVAWWAGRHARRAGREARRRADEIETELRRLQSRMAATPATATEPPGLPARTTP